MNIIHKLTWRHLRLNRGRTWITLLGIVLSVAMITAVAGFADSTRDMLRRTYMAASGDWHVIIFDVTEAQAAAVAKDPQVESSSTEVNHEGRLDVRFRIVKPTREYGQTAGEIARRCGILSEDFGFHTELLATEGVIAGDTTLMIVLSIGAVLILVIMGGSVVVIANAFYISASERVRQFGLLKSAGATKQQIRASVLMEGVLLSGVGIPLGIVFGFIIELIAIALANHLLMEVNKLNDGLIHFELVFSVWPVVITAALSFVTVMLSAWLPAGKCSKISPIDAIRLSGEIKLSSKQVKSSRLIQIIFGFEGTLAQKALGRNRQKYRATVISLVVSIVLFVTGYGFGQQIEKTAEFYYPDYGINAYAIAIGAYTEEFRTVADQILALDNADTERSYTNTLPSGDIAQYISPQAEKAYAGLTDNAPLMMRIHSITDAGYAKLCEELSLAPDTRAILINRVYLETEGKTAELNPFTFTKGMTVYYGENDEHSITLDAQINTVPSGILLSFRGKDMNILIPESAQRFDRAGNEDTRVGAFFSANAKDPAAFAEEAWALISTLAETDPSAAYDVQDVEAMTRMNKNLSLLITVFIMGFVGLLSLIAVTSVISTISAGMALRAPEFAMLSSVGMTPEGFARMLNLESLFYGLRALIIGLPLGLLCSYLVYRAIGISLEYSFIWPWQGMMASTAAVFLLTFVTMRYSRAKLKRVSIVEAIRNEVL